MEMLFFLCGVAAVGFVLCISLYLLVAGLPAIWEIGVTEFLFGTSWRLTESVPH